MSQILSAPETRSSLWVSEKLGITYRTLDYWLRQGYARSCAKMADGQGTRREFNRQDIAELMLMRDLRLLGVSVEQSAKMADELRRWIDTVWGSAPFVGTHSIIAEGERVWMRENLFGIYRPLIVVPLEPLYAEVDRLLQERHA